MKQLYEFLVSHFFRLEEVQSFEKGEDLQQLGLFALLTVFLEDAYYSLGIATFLGFDNIYLLFFTERLPFIWR